MTDRLWFKQIKKFRLDSGLSQQDLAAFLGVSQKTVSRWERGVDLPRRDVRTRLELLLADSPSTLLPSIFQAIQKLPIPLALIDGNGRLLVWSQSYPRRQATLAPSAMSALAPTTILIIEHDEAALRATQAILRRWNFLALGAKDLQTARQMLAEHAVRPVAAIISLNLPGEHDGVDAADELREILPQIPILIMTGDISADLEFKASASGYPLIAKPVNLDEMRLLLMTLAVTQSD